ncbi:uroporphyrinogen-III synthase [Paucisalibacillus globulus]|uniref:uroporphyrinogen-III synthase n=1 Tax=Paucisalibacillus globulus TaxID=351095 RepID=UPI00041EB8E5|nr:uroporphyrinogen-III synthase [Paucisalibacillus globulus]
MEFPLFGKNVLVTREASQAKLFTEQLLKNGAEVVEVPLLKIACKCSKENIKELRHLDKFNWVFFTSVNGVDCFFDMLEKNSMHIPNVKIAVVGHKTEEALNRYGYQAEIVPSRYDGETLVKEFLEKYEDIGQVLLVQGSRSRDVIEKGLSEAGIIYQTLVVYETIYNMDAREQLQKVLETTMFDFITFTSPSTVEAFAKLSNIEIPNDTIVVCIGTTTEVRANQLGLTNVISSKLFTIEGMIRVMCDITNREDQKTWN